MPMEEYLNHECVVCGVKYHHCDSCNHMSTFTPWRVICDTSEHYQIFMTIKDYQSNIISKEKAKEQLKIVGVTINDVKNFKDSAKVILNEILVEEVKESDIEKIETEETD